MACTPAQRRYQRRVLWLSLLYAGLLIGAIFLFKHHQVTGALAWIVAILPALPIVAIFAAIGVYIVEEQDEYQRMLLIRQTLYASAFTLSISTVWGFLESFGMVGHVAAYHAAILWFAGLGLGSLINRFTEGTWS
jgi:xanthosine utilization system XapX-like protein